MKLLKFLGLLIIVGVLVSYCSRSNTGKGPQKTRRASTDSIKISESELIKSSEIQQPSSNKKDIQSQSIIESDTETTNILSELKPYMYLGKPRSRGWFERAYKDLGDKIIYLDGQYLDVGEVLAKAPENSTLYEVFQIIGEDSIIVRQPEFWSFFHVTNVNTEGLVDGTKLRAKLISIGTYQYITVNGAIKTIPSCVIRTQLTRYQFNEALEQGFQLISYRKVKNRIIATPIR